MSTTGIRDPDGLHHGPGLVHQAPDADQIELAGVPPHPTGQRAGPAPRAPTSARRRVETHDGDAVIVDFRRPVRMPAGRDDRDLRAASARPQASCPARVSNEPTRGQKRCAHRQPSG